MSFVLPSIKQRTLIVGRTGSGKTQFGSWMLSKAAFDKQPYIIIDYKGDDLLGQIDRAKEIGYKDTVKHPGLYYLKAMPGTDAEMTAFLWSVWKRGKTGLFFDEGYMVPNTQALQAVLTQGRSLRIPVIMLSQRPVWLSRFAFSEADYFAFFHLNDERDEATVKGLTPRNDVWDFRTRVPKYHSRWFDVGEDFSAFISPVPDADTILNDFNERLRPKRKVI